jgi:hypothetical protein
VLRFIERREGAQRDNVRSPERARQDAPIDLACEIAGRTYAFEHTAVEPFTGQIANDVLFGRQMQPVADRITPHVPDDEHWEIVVAVDAMAGLTASAVAKAHDAVEVAIVKAAESAAVEPWGVMGHWPTKLGVEDGAPFPLAFRRFRLGEYSYRFMHGAHITRSVGPLEAPRAERMAKACADKFGKLAAWRAIGARTVLVLESNDYVLTNPQAVAEAYLVAERGQVDAPDEVYFVWALDSDGIESSPWYLTAVRIDARDHSDLWRDGPNLIEICPAELEDVTGAASVRTNGAG